MTRLELRVRKRFAGFTLDVDIDAPLAGTLGLVGPSGSGKSTLLACVAGHLAPDDGRIAVGERVLFDRAARVDVPPARRGVGMVFQEALLFPHLSVAANLRYGARRREPALFAEIVEALGVGDLLDRRPGALSGGERQRVALGRALLARPRLLLLDEPLASVDEARRRTILDLLDRLGHELGIAMVYVSHTPAEISRLTTRTLALRSGRAVALHDAPAPDVDPAGGLPRGRRRRRPRPATLALPRRARAAGPSTPR
jgi:molybdate transport system ATP-binding protein